MVPLAAIICETLLITLGGGCIEEGELEAPMAELKKEVGRALEFSGRPIEEGRLEAPREKTFTPY